MDENPGARPTVAAGTVPGMAGCCDPVGYRQVFNSREAARAVRAFERRGLDDTAAAMVGVLRARGIAGASVLEVGAGAGTAQVALLEAGAARSVAYDISPSYERIAGALLQGRGLGDRVTWRTGDVLADPAAPEADVVFLNRVVCCYPQMEPLVDAVVARTRRFLALAYPRDRWLTRVGIRTINGWLRLRRVPFRVFVHPPQGIEARIGGAGLRSAAAGRTRFWQWTVWERVEGGTA